MLPALPIDQGESPLSLRPFSTPKRRKKQKKEENDAEDANIVLIWKDLSSWWTDTANYL